jgi:hypothetical protein
MINIKFPVGITEKAVKGRLSPTPHDPSFISVWTSSFLFPPYRGLKWKRMLKQFSNESGGETLSDHLLESGGTVI